MSTRSNNTNEKSYLLPQRKINNIESETSVTLEELKMNEYEYERQVQVGVGEEQKEEFIVAIRDRDNSNDNGSTSTSTGTGSDNSENSRNNGRIQTDTDNHHRHHKKGMLRRFLSNMGRIKRNSWRRFSSNESGTFNDTNYDDIEDNSQENTNYVSIGNNPNGEYKEEDDDGSDGNQEEEEEVLFLEFFFTSKGPPQLVFITMLFALSLGSTLGIVPAVLTEQYATIYHGFDGTNMACTEYSRDDKPQACLDGSSDAQTAAAAASFVSNGLTFLTSSLIGAMSDEYGRRNVLIIGQFLGCLAPCVLLLLQIFNTMDPGWYYVANASTGLVSWISIALSSLSDVMPKKWRAPMFGLLLSGFSLGFALSPIIAIFFSHFATTVLSFSIVSLSFLYSVLCLPETLPPHQAAVARLRRTEYNLEENDSIWHCMSRGILRPFKELSILNRNDIFRLLSVLAFFSGMSTSADQTLLVYYVEDRLAFNDQDIAILFGMIGVIGVFVQGVLLKQITDFIGERLVVVVAFISGAITNTIYAFADTKQLIFFAVVVSSFTGMSFPTISAIKANNAEESEQGRIQGALYALSSLAGAIGPGMLRATYQVTMNTKYPGSFFLVATVFFTVAVFCAFALPKEKANSRTRNQYSGIAQVETTHV